MWLVYDNATFIIVGVYQTEAAARTATKAGQTPVAVPAADMLTVNVGLFYNTSTSRVQTPSIRSGIADLRDAGHQARRQLRNWREQLTEEGVVQPSAWVALGHDYLAQAEYGLFLALNNHRTSGNANWTVAQRIALCQQMSRGASDVTSPYTFFQALETSPGSLIPTPTGPVLWVNVNTGERVALNGAINNTTAMNLDVAQLPSASIADGSWIDGIMA